MSGHALVQRLPAAANYVESSHSIKAGQILKLERLLEKWVAMGYEPAAIVESPGTFSRRGGIVDIYPNFRVSCASGVFWRQG